MNGTCILGIDPGLSGALAYYFPETPERVGIDDMPTAGGEVDCATLVRCIERYRPVAAIVEQIAAHPVGGYVAKFKFGAAYGCVLGVLAALRVPTHLVRPQIWKKHFRIPSDKERSRALALRLFAHTAEHFARKKDDGRAEAALIARYGAECILQARAAA